MQSPTGSSPAVYRVAGLGTDGFGVPQISGLLLYETNMTMEEAATMRNIFVSEDKQAITGLLASLHRLSTLHWEAASNTTGVEGLGAGQYVCGAFAGMRVSTGPDGEMAEVFLLEPDEHDGPEGTAWVFWGDLHRG